MFLSGITLGDYEKQVHLVLEKMLDTGDMSALLYIIFRQGESYKYVYHEYIVPAWQDNMSAQACVALIRKDLGV